MCVCVAGNARMPVGRKTTCCLTHCLIGSHSQSGLRLRAGRMANCLSLCLPSCLLDSFPSVPLPVSTSVPHVFLYFPPSLITHHPLPSLLSLSAECWESVSTGETGKQIVLLHLKLKNCSHLPCHFNDPFAISFFFCAFFLFMGVEK